MVTTHLHYLACVILSLAVTCDSARGESSIRVGTGQRVITPDPLLPISGGLGPPQPATHKLGELTTRAVVIEQGELRLAIVSVDALGFPGVLIDRVAKQVRDIDPHNLIIGATHTHSAPDMYAFPDGQGGHTGNLDYIDRVCSEVAAAINEAVRRLEPAKLRSAVGEVDGQVAYNYYGVELYDRRANVLQFLDTQDRALATIVNYAIHPEVLGTDVGAVSPDLVGPLCDRIEDQVGGMALFINGAQGGMITADNRDLTEVADPLRGRWSDKREWSECVRIGQTLADEALRILKPSQTIADCIVQCEHRLIDFPVDSDPLWQVIQHSPLDYPHRKDRTITARINLVQLGPARIATIPGEALPNIGFYLKRKMSGQHNMLFGLTNDAFGYILTPVDFNSFPRYDYISRTSLGEQTGQILIDAILQLDQEVPHLSRPQ